MKTFKVDGMLEFDPETLFAQYLLVNAEDEDEAKKLVAEHYRHVYDKPFFHSVKLTEVNTSKRGVVVSSNDSFSME